LRGLRRWLLSHWLKGEQAPDFTFRNAVGAFWFDLDCLQVTAVNPVVAGLSVYYKRVCQLLDRVKRSPFY